MAPRIVFSTHIDHTDNISYYECDVSKWEEVELASKKIVEEVRWFGASHELKSECVLQIGHPTILINNAGVVQGKLLVDLSPEDVKQYVSVNCRSSSYFIIDLFQDLFCQHTGPFLDFESLPPRID